MNLARNFVVTRYDELTGKISALFEIEEFCFNFLIQFLFVEGMIALFLHGSD